MMINIIDNDNNNNRIMLGGGALPPLHPPCWPAVGRRENIGSGGAPAPPHPPPCAARALRLSVARALEFSKSRDRTHARTQKERVPEEAEIGVFPKSFDFFTGSRFAKNM